MTSMMSLLPVLLCAGMMFGGGVAAGLLARTPLRRLRSERRETVARRTDAGRDGELASHV